MEVLFFDFDFDTEEVEHALASFDAGCGAGPSGLRSQYIKELLRSPHKQELLEALAAFCSAFANGHFSKDAMRLFTCSPSCRSSQEGWWSATDCNGRHSTPACGQVRAFQCSWIRLTAPTASSGRSPGSQCGYIPKSPPHPLFFLDSVSIRRFGERSEPEP